MIDVIIPAAPLELSSLSQMASPQQIIKILPIINEIQPMVSHPYTPAETRVPDDCPCVRMMFALIAKIPKPRIPEVKTKESPSDFRQIIPLDNLPVPRRCEPRN